MVLAEVAWVGDVLEGYSSHGGKTMKLKICSEIGKIVGNGTPGEVRLDEERRQRAKAENIASCVIMLYTILFANPPRRFAPRRHPSTS